MKSAPYRSFHLQALALLFTLITSDAQAVTGHTRSDSPVPAAPQIKNGDYVLFLRIKAATKSVLSKKFLIPPISPKKLTEKASMLDQRDQKGRAATKESKSRF